jgi:general secretion pathway protein I
MRFASTGTPAAFPSRPSEGRGSRAGFTLVEALVALSLLLTFAAAFGPVLFQARHILSRGNGQIRAQLLLRSLLERPLADAGTGVREGESGGFHWRIAVEPFVDAAAFEPSPEGLAKATSYNWALYKVSARVFWGGEQSVAAETLRLAKTD